MKSVSQLNEGEFAKIRGRIRQAAQELLRAEDGRTCVYWDVRKDARSLPEQHEGQPFWVEDASGDKVLIRPESIRIVAGGEERSTLVETATSDLASVTSRIRIVKDELRAAGGTGKELRAERKRLAKIATLLCAIRAHARGNVHASANLEEQQRFIDANMSLVRADGLGTATMKMMVERLQIVLQPNDPVEVEGVFLMEPMPPDIGGAQGYRERPVCWAVRDGDQPAVLIGIGRMAPTAIKKKGAPASADAPSNPEPIPMPEHPPPHEDPIVRATAVIVTGLVIAYYFLFGFG